MGCDIHAYVEHKKNGVWMPSDIWVLDKEEGWRVPYHCGIDTQRHYNWFAFLADVRNCTWGEKIPVVFEPRGIPEDCCEHITEAVDRWGEDGHSHSYITLRELEAAYTLHKDTNIEFNGALDPRNPSPELKEWLEKPWDKRGSPPGGYCASGGGGGYIYPKFRWVEKLHELIGTVYGDWYSYLWDVGFEYAIPNRKDDIRVVFWFDN